MLREFTFWHDPNRPLPMNMTLLGVLLYFVSRSLSTIELVLVMSVPVTLFEHRRFLLLTMGIFVVCVVNEVLQTVEIRGILIFVMISAA